MRALQVRAAIVAFAYLSVVCFDLFVAPHASADPRLDADRPVDAGETRKPEEPKWAVTLWAGVFSNSHLPEVVTLSAEYEDSYLALVALSRQIVALGKHARLEVEGQVGKHIGAQKQWELNALVIARWVTFPWNAYLATTFAFGEGISYATELPKLEEQEEGASQWLNYLLFELTFALPKHPEWALVARLHHRSGFWGALAPNGSNAVGVGLKYRF